MDTINKDNALQTAGTVAFVTLVVAGTHALMGFLSDGISSVQTNHDVHLHHQPQVLRCHLSVGNPFGAADG